MISVRSKIEAAIFQERDGKASRQFSCVSRVLHCRSQGNSLVVKFMLLSGSTFEWCIMKGAFSKKYPSSAVLSNLVKVLSGLK